MKFKLFFTILISKLIIKACRLFKTGGTTLAGKAALKIFPGIIKTVSQNFLTIMVTGTNGKTTTARIIGRLLKENGIDYITNKSGANLMSGIAAAFMDAVGLSGGCMAKTALLEVDEAAFRKAVEHIEPDILVATNFFRDQLDRYGELYSTLKGVLEGLRKTVKTRLVLNADDSLCVSLSKDSGKETVFYGIGSGAFGSQDKAINSDAMFCLYCKSKYEYANVVYGHLGEFRCPGCGYSRPFAQVLCTSIKEFSGSHSIIEFQVNAPPEEARGAANGVPVKLCRVREHYVGKYEAKVNLPGLYNIYNSLAAAACGVMMELPPESIAKALGNFECGFGRMESISANDKTLKVALVKNPTGFNQIIELLAAENKTAQIAFAINDKLADGTDVSWLWDVDFERLLAIQDRVGCFYASGVRAEDLAIRLKYAGVIPDKIAVVKDYRKLIEIGLSNTDEGGVFYILPTYTAMLDIRRILRNRFGLKNFWK